MDREQVIQTLMRVQCLNGPPMTRSEAEDWLTRAEAAMDMQVMLARAEGSAAVQALLIRLGVIPPERKQ